jgi:hypothetical protein
VPVPGRPRNPLGLRPDRLRQRPHVFVERPGTTPGLQDLDVRADTAAPGTIRRLWRQSVNYVPAPAPFGWTQHPATVTRALRYKASTTFRQAGTSNTREGAARAIVPGRHKSKPVTIAAGNRQGRPTIRNRLTSFGSSVAPTNRPSPAAQRS